MFEHLFRVGWMWDKKPGRFKARIATPKFGFGVRLYEMDAFCSERGYRLRPAVQFWPSKYTTFFFASEQDANEFQKQFGGKAINQRF